MKTHLFAAACSLVAISGLSVAAQQPPTQTPPTQQTPPSQPAQRPPDPTTEPVTPAQRPSAPMADIARTATTVTGCLKTWDDKTSAASTTAASGQFVLTGIERAGGASRGAASSYLLKSSDPGVSFSQHLNHKVEVTGSLTDSAPGMGTGTSTSGTPAKPQSDKPSTDRDASATGRTDDMKLPTLNVRSLKMIAPTCGGS
jgi:hypothetical protein